MDMTLMTSIGKVNIDGGRFDEQGYDYLALTETVMIGEGMIKEA